MPRKITKSELLEENARFRTALDRIDIQWDKWQWLSGPESARIASKALRRPPVGIYGPGAILNGECIKDWCLVYGHEGQRQIVPGSIMNHRPTQTQGNRQMKLKSIYIGRGYSQDDPLRGTVEFYGQYGEIKVALDERLTKKVMDICAEELVESTKEVAQLMTSQVIEATNGTPAITDESDTPEESEGDGSSNDDDEIPF